MGHYFCFFLTAFGSSVVFVFTRSPNQQSTFGFFGVFVFVVIACR
jgi:hypothetical protein